ncbi:MAG: hypothetical protein LBB54_00760 [Cellulomonadaceae bacterium]|jgi:hypothetical protein|nr:hypothetical protein [Cellulomonadaceae bacterium]
MGRKPHVLTVTSTKQKFCAAVLAALTVPLILSGCGSAKADALSDSSSQVTEQMSAEGTYDFAGMLANFHATAATLDFPDGHTEWEPPKPPPDVLPDGTIREPVYEQGFGESVAYSYWMCSWQREWLEQRGTSDEAASHALAVLATFPDTPGWRWWDPESAQSHFLSMIEKASLGDPTEMQKDVVFCNQW